MRLSTLPTAFGEKMVMRIFDPERRSRRSSSWASAPRGAALAGADRAAARHRPRHRPHRQRQDDHAVQHAEALATDEVNVCTIEDPIEMIEPAFNQTQVQPAIDMGFAEGLRALMRQDPDIIMVGEIRDLATAEMAIQAALTGHLVFSTLHTNDAASAITRLADLGVPPYLIAPP
jgi:general secretion pathway protein E